MFHIILEQNIPCLSYRQIIDWESHVLKLIARRLKKPESMGFHAFIISKKEIMETQSVEVCAYIIIVGGKE